MQFHKAERKKAKLRLAICGPSGSGKTMSALLIAKGIGGNVAMIDTESGSGELYADSPKIGLSYDVLQFDPPYTPQRAIEAIQAAQRAGYSVVIFDSLSHVWMGEGGMLEMVDAAAKGLQGNSFAAWKNVRPHEKKFLEAITRTDIHIIATMRTKTEWTTEKDPRTGKNRPVKVGLKPEQREGLEYEFTVVFDMTIDSNIATAGKDRTDMFKDQFFTPTEETGEKLLAWLERGTGAMPPQTEPESNPAPKSDERPAGLVSPNKVQRIQILFKEIGVADRDDRMNQVNDWLKRGGKIPVSSTNELTEDLANSLIKGLEKRRVDMTPTGDPFGPPYGAPEENAAAYSANPQF